MRRGAAHQQQLQHKHEWRHCQWAASIQRQLAPPVADWLAELAARGGAYKNSCSFVCDAAAAAAAGERGSGCPLVAVRRRRVYAPVQLNVRPPRYARYVNRVSQNFTVNRQVRTAWNN